MTDTPTEYTQGLKPPKWEVGEKIVVDDGARIFTATITEVGQEQPDRTRTVTATEFPDAPNWQYIAEQYNQTAQALFPK